MKKFVILLAAVLLTIFSAGIITAFAFSGSVTIEGDRQVSAGTTHKYTITVSVEDAGTVIANIVCSGAFIKDSGDSMIEWSQTANSSDVVYTGSFTVRVPSTAKPGETGTISVNGSVVSFINDKYDTDEKDFSGSLTAEVAEGSPAPEPSEWDDALASLQSMQAGDALSLEITDSAVIPADVLSALKEKQGTLTLGFTDYSCIIDGKSLSGIPGSIKTADITISMEKEKALSTAANGQDIYQLNFAHEGQLPGRFRFSFAAAESKPGDILYLYRYYSGSGVLEGIGASAVDADGLADFDIYYCSGYVVSNSIIEGAAGSLSSGSALAEQLQAQLEDAQNTSEELQSEVDKLKSEASPEKNPLTASIFGPSGNLFGVPYGSLIAALLGVALISMFLTMVFCRVGVFRKKTNSRNHI